MQIYQGLTESEAQKRLQQHGKNQLTAKKRNNALRILLSIIFEPIIAILIICAIIYFSLGTLTEAIFMAATVFVAIFMSWWQENKTEKALQALKNLSSPRTSVIRDGVTKIISSTELVPGDTIILHEGDRIPVDGKIIEINLFFVDESIVTGESIPVEKANEGEVFSGTLVVRGDAVVNVTATGNLSTIGKIGTSIKEIPSERTLLQKRITKLAQTLGVVALIICTVVFVLTLKMGRPWQEGILSSLATAMSLMPEEFPMVLTIYLALGSWKLSKISVLARKSSAIENLGAISVLCVDKTGTLTMNEMSVAKHVGDEREIIRAAYFASDLQPSDPMERALLKKNQELKIDGAEKKLLETIPVSKEFTAFRSLYQIDNTLQAFIKGAPETVMDQSTLIEDEKNKFKNEILNLANAGYRVLGVADKTIQSKENWSDGKWHWLGLIAFLDPIREEVPKAVTKCYEAGIEIKMLTGDHPGTSTTIAKMVGIKNPEKVISGSELAALSPHELTTTVQNTNVYARVKPDQKLTLIQSLKANGHHVAMTGDGVNDAPALKASNIGVAMGKRGADVAREAADIVLLDDNFASMVNAIEEGRTIYTNIQKSFSFLLGIHIIIGILSFLPMLLGYPPLLYPLHLVMIEFVVDPAASVVFAHELADANIMKVPPRRSDQPLFSLKELRNVLFRGIIFTALIMLTFWGLINAGFAVERSRLIGFAMVNSIIFLMLFKSIKSKPARLWGLRILLGTAGIFLLILFFSSTRQALHIG